jgi:hypothetical protein
VIFDKHKIEMIITNIYISTRNNAKIITNLDIITHKTVEKKDNNNN